MQKLSQTEELARTLAARARRHTLTPEQISRAMDEQDYDVAQLDELYTALEARGVHLAEDAEEILPALTMRRSGRWNRSCLPRAWRWRIRSRPI